MLIASGYNAGILNANADAEIQIPNPYENSMRVIGYSLLYPAGQEGMLVKLEYNDRRLINAGTLAPAVGNAATAARDNAIFIRFPEGQRPLWEANKTMKLTVQPTASVNPKLISIAFYILPDKQ